ncbi:MAG: nucleotidyl transferase [uncultured bacterium]|nr:MAG: nucleotidyl transferase [uncultured bacterium]
MRAIILAAGRGKRMGDLTEKYPKAMLNLHGNPLIEWQMQAIRRAGITDTAIVKGYMGDVFSYKVNYFENTRWEQTNMLSTLMCADSWLSQHTCIVSYSDIIYTKEAVQALKNSLGDISITFDPNWLKLWEQRFDDPLSDAEIFKYENNILIDVGGKAKGLDEIQGQYMGLLKFTVDGWQKTKKFLQELSSGITDKMDMTALLKLMLKNNFKITVAAINSPWCEVDNINDYQLCQKIMHKNLFLPS